nr:DEAD/DEAH box helicase [Desulfobacterales bacterium]
MKISGIDYSSSPECHKGGSLSLKEVIKAISSSKRFGPNITAIRRIERKEGIFKPFPGWINQALLHALRESGIVQLYSHQAEALECIAAGKNPVIVTPTSSGKTLCYNIPAINAILEEGHARSLYLFPTKALAQDQMAGINEMIAILGDDIKVFTYDGDTPGEARKAIRQQTDIVITNPDMLHTGILPHHTRWQKLFSGLRFVVIDELHYYRGVFGSHLTNVIRRLKRICRFYGSQPQFICCSATIANPKELAQNIIEEDVVCIDQNGAPQGEKYIIFYNPPVVNKELGTRASTLNEARRLASLFIKNSIQTIVFTTSRVNVEVLTKYLKDLFVRKKTGNDMFICGYRGGYLPRLRRSIERGLREREIMGVVSTNALELGVDIGDLEACIIAGYPGTIASTWQQAGRAGRRMGTSLALLIARSNPLDQFIVQNPDYFFTRSPEFGLINPDNLLILVSHIKAASFELPFSAHEKFGKENLVEILEYLEENRVLHRAGKRWYWSGSSYPADDISLRNVSTDNFLVVDTTEDNRIIGEVDYRSAPYTIHKGAIYMVESEQYHVDDLDWTRKKAYVHKVDVDYYTDAMSYINVRILHEFENRRFDHGMVEHGEVQVTSRVVGFKKIRFYTSENVGYGEVSLPDQEAHTTSYWFTIFQEVLDQLGYSRPDLVDGILGVAFVMHHIAAFSLMCDIKDIEHCIGDKSGKWFVRHLRGERGIYTFHDDQMMEVVPDIMDTFDPTVFIFDRYPGGVGF